MRGLDQERRPGKIAVAYSSPGEPDQYAIIYEDASFKGIDELPQDEVPIILYD
jgi:hypothetical protein